MTKHIIKLEWDSDCPVCQGHFWIATPSGVAEMCPRCNSILYGQTIEELQKITKK